MGIIELMIGLIMNKLLLLCWRVWKGDMRHERVDWHVKLVSKCSVFSLKLLGQKCHTLHLKRVSNACLSACWSQDECWGAIPHSTCQHMSQRHLQHWVCPPCLPTLS